MAMVNVTADVVDMATVDTTVAPLKVVDPSDLDYVILDSKLLRRAPVHHSPCQTDQK